MAKLVVIDPGHGGSDPGATGNGLRECNLTLSISKRIKTALLRDYDVEVKLTRSTDKAVSLGDRARFANDRGAAYFVAVHINSASSGASGYEDFIHNKAGAATSARRGELHAEIAAFLAREGLADRGSKRANFAVLRETAMSAVLTENLFISTASDAARLKDASFLKGLAEAHARGIAAALNLPRVTAPVG